MEEEAADPNWPYFFEILELGNHRRSAKTERVRVELVGDL